MAEIINAFWMITSGIFLFLFIAGSLLLVALGAAMVEGDRIAAKAEPVNPIEFGIDAVEANRTVGRLLREDRKRTQYRRCVRGI